MKHRRAIIDTRIEDAITQTPIAVETFLECGTAGTPEGDLPAGPERTTGMLAARVAPHIVRAIAEEAETTTGNGRPARTAHDAWAHGAEAHARRWLEARAPAAHWARLVRSIRRAQATVRDTALIVGTLAVLAEHGPAFADALDAQAPWVVRERLWGPWGDALGDDPTVWAGRIVACKAEQLGRTGVDAAAGEAALAHWRWPNVRPPLAVVAAGAGMLAPIESDSAWANACTASAKACIVSAHAQWDAEGRRVRAMRAHEERCIEEAIDEVRALAREQVGGGPKKARGALEQARARWKASPALEGDGRVGTPRLVAVGPMYQHSVRWRFEVDGPEILSAASALEGVSLTDIAGKIEAGGTALVVSIDKDARKGHLVRGKALGGGRARAQALHDTARALETA